MENVMNRIELFHNLFLVCLIGMIIFLIISVVLFRKLDIREVMKFFARKFRKKRYLVLPILMIAAVTLEVRAMESETIVPDTIAPELKNVQYIEPMNSDGEEAMRMYYEDGISITFEISDTYLLPENVQVQIYRRQHWFLQEWGEPIKIYSGNELCKDEVFEFSIPEEEGEYYFTISYADQVGNLMTGEGKIKDGTFYSPIFVVDKTMPAYRIQYTRLEDETVELNSSESGMELEPYGYCTEGIMAELIFTEENLDFKNTKVKVTAVDANGEPVMAEESDIYSQTWEALMKSGTAALGENKVPDQHKLVLELKTEAHYVIEIEIADKTGKMIHHSKSFCIDRTAPEIVGISYICENPEQVPKLIDKITFGCFADGKVRAHITARDKISGVEDICYTYTDMNGTSVTEFVPVTMNEKDKSIFEYQLELPFSFKGIVKAYGIDYTGNQNHENQYESIGVIAESKETHEATSYLSVHVMSNYSKTPNYYNGDVKIQFRAQDQYSGLNQITYLAGNDLDETINTYGQAGSEIEVGESIRDYTINALYNNENNLVLGLSFTDNAGYETKVLEENLPKINIDVTKPSVTVEYDNYNVLNENYYKTERTATVIVRERNFDPEDVQFELTGPQVQIGEWSHSGSPTCNGGSDSQSTDHTDECQWKTTVRFSEDGDYTFGFRCTDLAGNTGDYGQIDSFVLDRTIPIIKVSYDNYDARNEIYYGAPRTATIQIEEHNFQAEDVEIVLTAKNKNEIIAAPPISGWSGAGDMHTTWIQYDYDGEFAFDIVYTDLAGNESADYMEDVFTIDLTAPEILISQVEHLSANNGVVAPTITITDANYDASGAAVTLAGANSGLINFESGTAPLANGQIIQMKDIERTREKDDLYTLRILAADLAGNTFEENIQFSVNRFGSVYTFDEKTENLVGEHGKYYLNEAPELVITETNVDTLEFQEITCSLSGKMETLKEGTDYIVRKNVDDAGWKQYTYHILANNFSEDGLYAVTIYSEDRATNVSDNHSRGKKMEFVLDTGKPTLVISGVEDQEQYREHSREITLDVQDNMALSKVKVTLNGKTTHYTAAEIERMNGKIVFKAGSANDWQKLKVKVFDMAGNGPTVEEREFLITANLFIQFAQNRALMMGIVSTVVVLATGICIYILLFRNKKSAASS